MKVEFTKVELNDKALVVSGHSTLFISFTRWITPGIGEVLAKLKDVRKMARDSGVKIQRAGYKKRLEALNASGEYSQQVIEYETLWQQLRTGWEHKIAEGLYAPILDDKDYISLRDMNFRIQKMGYRTSPMSIVRSIYRNLVELEQELKEGSCGLIAISL